MTPPINILRIATDRKHDAAERVIDCNMMQSSSAAAFAFSVALLNYEQAAGDLERVMKLIFDLRSPAPRVPASWEYLAADACERIGREP